MNIMDFINKDKMRCDDIISISLILVMFFLFVFFRLIAFTSLIIYPISSLFIYGIFHIYRSLFKREELVMKRIGNFILGGLYLSFSMFIFFLIFSHPSMNLSHIVIYLSIPVFFIGLAAILKGALVNVYSNTYRKINIFIGFLTLIITFLALYIVELNFTLSLISLIVILIVNGISRSGMYLSEYGLSLRNIKNIKYVFFIMDNLVIVDLEEEANY